MKKILDYIDSGENIIIDLQKGLTSRPAINPENGGNGEYEKFLYLKEYIEKIGFDKIEEEFAPDERVSDKIRPSLIATINGENNSKNLWIISHTDVVPPGELKLWDTDPYTATVKNGKIYGRGTEDNQQSIVSSILAARALIENKVKPFYTVKLLFVADEEVGSEYGIQWFLKNRNYFSKDDIIIIPDGGDSKGSTIEIAEKSILWINFKLFGKQSHGSRPDLGINTARASSHLCVRMESLNKIFSEKDGMYDIPYSTFEPTKRSNAITNMNTIPGEENLSFDCRILPLYNLEDIKNEINEIKKSVEDDFGVKIETEYVQNIQAPPPTSETSEVVELLKKSIKKIMNIDASPIGIGGGTVAAYFRMEGYSTAIWSTIDSTMHSPNEYSKISNTINDAKVFANLMTGA